MKTRAPFRLIAVGLTFLAGTFSLPPAPQDSYPESEKGLKQLIENLLRHVKASDKEGFDAAVQGLILPDPAGWFAATFPPEHGEHMVEDYEKLKGSLACDLYNDFGVMVREKWGLAEVYKFEESCGLSVSTTQYPVLAARRTKAPFYSVVFQSGGQGRTLWFFAHVDGGFRFLGPIQLRGLAVASARKDKTAEVEPDSPPRKVRIEGKVTPASLVYREGPVYPERARNAGLQGMVKLKAIGRDGKLKDIEVTSGHCWLVEAALEAVGKWRYKPTLLNGEAIEVVTTIDVAFTFSS